MVGGCWEVDGEILPYGCWKISGDIIPSNVVTAKFVCRKCRAPIEPRRWKSDTNAPVCENGHLISDVGVMTKKNADYQDVVELTDYLEVLFGLPPELRERIIPADDDLDSLDLDEFNELFYG